MVGPLDRLVGAADGSAVDHGVRQRLAAGKVEIGEHELAPADELVLGSDRLLDLDDHLGRGIHILDRRENRGADRRIGRIREPAVLTGRSLHIDLVAPFGQLLRPGRREADAVLVVLDLLGNSDNHNAGSF